MYYENKEQNRKVVREILAGKSAAAVSKEYGHYRDWAQVNVLSPERSRLAEMLHRGFLHTNVKLAAFVCDGRFSPEMISPYRDQLLALFEWGWWLIDSGIFELSRVDSVRIRLESLPWAGEYKLDATPAN